MLLIAHIAIALLSIAWTTCAVFLPSKAKINGSWAMVAATLVTGTALVMSTGQHILQACITGLLYTAVVAAGVALAQQRLTKQEN